MRGAPGVPALGHVGLDPRRCSACLGDRAPAPPPPPPRPARARRVVPLPSTDVTAPTPHAEWLDRVMPGFADATDEYCDRVQGVGSHAHKHRASGTYLERARARTARAAARPLSARLHVLLTVWTQTRAGRAPVHFGEIVVSAFERSPEHFALAGHPGHPDSGRVQKYLSGREGLVARGLIERVAPRMYRVTPRGRRRAAKIAREAT